VPHLPLLKTQCTAGLSRDRMIMEYTDEYCDMRETLGACNSRAGTAAQEYALRYPGRRHPDTNVFRRLEQRLLETGSVTPTTLVKAGRLRTVRTPANEDAISQLWNESRGEVHAISHENWDYPNRGSSKYFMMINCIHTTTCGALICFQTIVLYGCNFSNCYDIKTSTSTTVTSGHGIILMLSANVGIKSTSASAFGFVSSGTLLWAPICYQTG
jgi:hypothetical protein